MPAVRFSILPMKNSGLETQYGILTLQAKLSVLRSRVPYCWPRLSAPILLIAALMKVISGCYNLAVSRNTAPIWGVRPIGVAGLEESPRRDRWHWPWWLLLSFNHSIIISEQPGQKFNTKLYYFSLWYILAGQSSSNLIRHLKSLIPIKTLVLMWSKSTTRNLSG